MFEKATRQKLRFDSPKGQMSVEDVWDLPLKHATRFDLDTLAKAINREIREQEEESFVEAPSKANETLKLKLDIVKHIIDVRKAEVEAREKAQERKREEEVILGIIERRERQELENLPTEDLRKRLEN